MTERKRCIRYSVCDRIVFGGAGGETEDLKWMDRKKQAIVRLEIRSQVSLRDSGCHRGRHQSQDQAWLPHQFSQSQIQKAEGTQGRYGWPHTLPAHWINWVGLNHINLTSHLSLPHIPHNIIRLAIVSNINCKWNFSCEIH